MTNSMHGGRADWLMDERWFVAVNDEVGGKWVKAES